MQRLATPDEVVAFWREAGPEKWFSKDEAFDQACRDRFLPTYEAAARGDLNEWELTPEGALAVILLLDQFPRNMFRGKRETYKTDPVALMAADRAIETRLRQAGGARRSAASSTCPSCTPKSLRHQERSVTLNEALGERIRSSGHATITRSSPASAASPIATPSWAARPRPRRRRSWRRATSGARPASRSLPRRAPWRRRRCARPPRGRPPSSA